SGSEDRVLVDPAALDERGLIALDWWYPNRDGSLVAYGVSENGDELSTLHVLDVASGRLRSDKIPNTRATSLAWLPDGSGFYYTRLEDAAYYRRHVRFHELGTPSDSDRVVFGAGRDAEEWPLVALSHSGRFLIVTAHRGWSSSDVYVADRARSDTDFRVAVESRSATYDADTMGDQLIVRTNDGAARFALFEAPLERPERAGWAPVVPETEGVLQGVAIARDAFVLTYTREVAAEVVVRRRDGTSFAVELPPLGSVAAASASEDSDDVYLHFESYLEAPTIFRLDARDGTTDVWERLSSPIDPKAYDVRREWFVSRDGTRVPLFVLAARERARDGGGAPCVLTGYGGFAISRTPKFVASIVPWLDAGGVYAVANLRGGGEFGAAWHRAGMRANKQNVFDDFIAARDYLASSGIADPARIGIVGGSNGGLLVAAAAVQRPDLARAVVCAVPLTDMLRFPRFLLGRLWVDEYGDPDDANDFPHLFAYSPYHNVREGVAYPSMLIVSAEADSRVDPAHARKFAARLQAASSSGRPVYVYVEAQAGHGAGKPRTKLVEELVDRWSYFGNELGVTFLR
ncbi:MAG: prolyl oligopeptidase family serine peptidase, partial [Candidatus Baltobacteraceae bacterium]